MELPRLAQSIWKTTALLFILRVALSSDEGLRTVAMTCGGFRRAVRRKSEDGARGSREPILPQIGDALGQAGPLASPHHQ